jgi:hypothetical protein
MKKYSTALLIAVLFLPIATIFIFDAYYGSVQNKICAQPIRKESKEVEYACTYSERTERDRIVTTAFYRHVGDYFGRSVDTSPSWMDEAMYGTNGFAVQRELAQFNQKFALAMIFSIIAASSAGTILAQKCQKHYKTK